MVDWEWEKMLAHPLDSLLPWWVLLLDYWERMLARPLDSLLPWWVLLLDYWEM